MRRWSLLALAVAAASCNGKPDPFAPVPECKGAAVTPFMGSRQLVVSSLTIADPGIGFDLDRNGTVDNKLAPLGSVANPQLAMSFTTKHDVVLPIELFGYMGEANTTCTKLAFYIGKLLQDKDGDGAQTSWVKGSADCDDTDPAAHPGATEVAGNRVDLNCDGLADNVGGTASTDTQDLDGDGVTLAGGDCDDRADAAHLAVAKARHPGATEICGNGIDEDCNGIADDGPGCDPYGKNDLTVPVQAVSFDASMQPLIAFKDGLVKAGVLAAGPDAFSLTVPLQSTTMVNLSLSGARLSVPLDDQAGLTSVDNMGGMLGGVLEAVTLAQVKGLKVSGVVMPDQSLLDAAFVGALPSVLLLDQDKDNHYLPDIDVDGDGLESFWSSNPTPGDAHVDMCKDGDGTIVMGTDCPLAKDSKGRYRFVDGLSIALKFTAVPAKLAPAQ